MPPRARVAMSVSEFANKRGVAFAAWMRGHARDPRHMEHVLTTNGWEGMRWERLSDLDPSDGGWAVHVIATSELSTDQVAEQVLMWCRRAIGGGEPVMRVGSRGR